MHISSSGLSFPASHPNLLLIFKTLVYWRNSFLNTSFSLQAPKKSQKSSPLSFLYMPYIFVPSDNPSALAEPLSCSQF